MIELPKKFRRGRYMGGEGKTTLKGTENSRGRGMGGRVSGVKKKVI